MTFAKEAWPFVLPFLLLGILLLFLRHPGWAVASIVLGLLILLFFRNPHRSYGGGAETILAAADGKVLRVEELEDPEVGPGRYLRVVTFLSVFDVHVQRVPVSGKVVDSKLTRGRKVAAFQGDAGEVNERQLTVIETDEGHRIGIRQIVGLVARRTVTYLETGQNVTRGEMLGLIKFGSRVDLLVPKEHYEVLVEAGARVANGSTPMARPVSSAGAAGAVEGLP